MMDQIMTMRIFLSHLSNFVCFFVTSVGNGENVFMLWMSSSFGCRRARLTVGCMSLRGSGFRSTAGKTFWRLLPGTSDRRTSQCTGFFQSVQRNGKKRNFFFD